MEDIAVAGGTMVIDAIRAMRAASLATMPVVAAAAVGSGTKTLQYVITASTTDPYMPTTPCISC